jgi:hypothetical protein
LLIVLFAEEGSAGAVEAKAACSSVALEEAGLLDAIGSSEALATAAMDTETAWLAEMFAVLEGATPPLPIVSNTN